MPLAYAVEDIGKPFLRIDAVELGRLQQRKHGSGALTTAIGACKKPVLAAHSYAPEGALRRIVVDLQPAVVGVGEQLRLQLHGITQRLGQR